MKHKVNSLGIYIHIPFCIKKCPYCGFTSFTPESIPEDEYIKALIREMEARKEETENNIVETVYFGGGTPSLLSLKGIETILNAISKNFKIIPPHPAPLPQGEREITLEANPGTVNLEKLKDFKDAGINRINIGIQSLNDKLLSTLGRVHTRQEALNAYESARKVGFENIGVDLIHSKAGETLADWKKDLKEAVSLRPEHISAYSLTIEEETHFSHLQKKGLLILPTEEEQAETFLMTKEILEKAGYEHYEVSNYALPCFRSRHNQRYWKGREYLGFGVSAHSYIANSPSLPLFSKEGDGGSYRFDVRGLSPFTDEAERSRRMGTVPGCKIWGIRRANTSNLAEYFKLINEKGTAIVEEERLAKEKSMGEAIFLGLRMMEGIDLKHFKERFGGGMEEVFPDALKELIEKGLLEIEKGRLRLTNKGILFLDEVSVHFV